MNTRQERQESHWRRSVHKELMELCSVMNPTEKLTFGGMKYSELVTYTRDLLDKEVGHLTNQTEEPGSLKLE